MTYKAGDMVMVKAMIGDDFEKDFVGCVKWNNHTSLTVENESTGEVFEVGVGQVEVYYG